MVGSTVLRAKEILIYITIQLGMLVETLSLNYKNFSLYGSIGNRYNSLYGESIDYGEKNSVIQMFL